MWFCTTESSPPRVVALLPGLAGWIRTGVDEWCLLYGTVTRWADDLVPSVLKRFQPSIHTEPSDMICSFCDENNPEANRYCGHCGEALNVASQKLRQQIVSIINEEFKDQEMVAATVGEKVANKAEERLWQWAKVLGFAGTILGLAMTVFLAELGFFGFTSYKEARSRINSASQVAITKFNQASEQSITSLNKVAKENQQIIVQKGSETTLQMQQQARLASTQVASVVSGAKASKSDLDRTEQALNVEKARIEELKKIRDQLPDTPIGNITGNLFVPTLPQGQALNGTTLLGSGTNPAMTASGLPIGNNLTNTGVTPPYKGGATGPGVTEIQTRLAALGCYQGQPSGTFDPDTTKALSAFASANPPAPGDIFLAAPSLSLEVPSPFLTDSTPGTVDYALWTRLFSTTAKMCQ